MIHDCISSIKVKLSEQHVLLLVVILLNNMKSLMVNDELRMKPLGLEDFTID